MQNLILSLMFNALYIYDTGNFIQLMPNGNLEFPLRSCELVM